MSFLLGSDVSAPTPSPEEQQIWQTLQAYLGQSLDFQKEMMPEYMRLMHYKKVITTPYSKTTGGDYTDEQKEIIRQRDEVVKQIDQIDPNDPYSSQKEEALNAALKRFNDQINTFTKPTTETEEKSKWVKMTDEEWYNDPNTTDTERKQWDLYQSTLDRQQKALNGELPLDQNLLDQKNKEFQQLKQTFNISGNSLDSAKGNDTVAIQNLNEFKKRWGTVEQQQQYGQLNSGTQNTLAMTGLTNDLAQNTIGGLYGAGGVNNSILGGYQGLLSGYQNYNQAGWQTNMFNQQQQQAGLGSLLQLGGMLGMAGILHSSRKFKKDIKEKTARDENRALKLVRGTKSYSYRYKPEMGYGDDTMLGAIAEESPDEVTNKEKTLINLGNKLELVGMSVKSLARKVDRIRRSA